MSVPVSMSMSMTVRKIRFFVTCTAPLLAKSINWRYKDSQHLLIFVEDFKISDLTESGEMFLAESKMVSL